MEAGIVHVADGYGQKATGNNKENKMKKLAFVVLGVIAVIGLLTAFDGEGRRFNDGDHHPMKDRMFKDGDRQGRMYDGFENMCEELELTDEQIEKMEALQISSKKDMINTGAELKILEINKRTAMKNKDFKQARAITKEIFKLKEQIAIKRIENQEKRWNILTPEQQEKADELKGEHRPLKHKKIKRKK